jgi:hypothetical protein
MTYLQQLRREVELFKGGSGGVDVAFSRLQSQKPEDSMQKSFELLSGKNFNVKQFAVFHIVRKQRSEQ